MSYVKTMADVLRLEANSLLRAADLLETNHEADTKKLTVLYEKLINSEGNIVFCGVGKSGIIAQKCASTLTSLGLASYFLHPTEALHGDMGRIKKNDVIVFLSKSGTTEEILKLLPFLTLAKEQRIALVGQIPSPISAACDIVFDCSVEKEACINNQAPTTSSTLALAMGDAMAVIFESLIGLSKEGFAANHPGGILGKSLRMKVRDLMIERPNCPVLAPTNTLRDAILAMTQLPVGGCAVVDGEVFKGILVEGDIRRTLTKENLGLDTKLDLIINKNPTCIVPEELAYQALNLMESRERPFQLLPVIGEKKFLGFIRLHELLKEGFSFKGDFK